MTHKIDSGAPPRPLDAVAATGAQRAGAARGQPVAAAPAADNLRLTGEAAGLQAIERRLAGPAGIDLAKVDAIRASIAEGSYRIDPQEIATRLLSLERELGG
jgi:negative regulator of flagellin synthesis FlgM